MRLRNQLMASLLVVLIGTACQGTLAVADLETEATGDPPPFDPEVPEPAGDPLPVFCDQAPWSCERGTTCALAAGGAWLACLSSGRGAVGTACRNEGGLAACTDGSTCIVAPGEGAGVCTPYCDDLHACPAGVACSAYTIIGTGTSIRVCDPAAAGRIVGPS